MNLYETSDGIKIDLNEADLIIQDNIEKINNKAKFFKGLTNTKLRGLLNPVNQLYTKIFYTKNNELAEHFIDELDYLKVKFAYEAGREKSVKVFLEKTYIIEIIDNVISSKSKKDFLNFCKYFEALVAYAKYYGMGD